ncbi:hypothetical protein GCM10020331_057880 [Ectobacillus funiculus]
MGEETKEKNQTRDRAIRLSSELCGEKLKAKKRTYMMGIIVANIMHRVSTEISRAIEDYCHEHDMHAIVCNADDDPHKEKKYIEMLRARQVDGLIIFFRPVEIQSCIQRWSKNAIRLYLWIGK